MMWAAFILEREFATLADLPRIFFDWLSVSGVVAMAALVFWSLMRISLGRGSVWMNGLSGRLTNVDPSQVWKLRLFWIFGSVTLLSMFACLGWSIKIIWFDEQSIWKVIEQNSIFRTLWIVGAGASLLTLSWEFFLDVFTLSPRRLWAIARFSIVEAIRRKVLWGFAGLLLVFLFGSWFIQSARPSTQWSTYVNLVYFIMSALMLLTASTVACFSIPNDIKNLSIHTVVTKPVQKFEIVLGRILGLVLLMTVVMVVASLLSLLYIVRGVDDAVSRQAQRARVPLFGSLVFKELSPTGEWITKDMGIFIGREFDLRQYIRGASNQEAVWTFGLAGLKLDPKAQRVFARLAKRENFAVEFMFDIFRTSKGGVEQYREGVDVQLTFINRAKWNDARYSEYREARDPQTGLPLTPALKAKEFGYYEAPPITVVDEKADHDRILVPATLLEGIEAGFLEVRVGCRSHSQYLGCYKYDLYILDDEANFFLNYMKGATGIWFFTVLVIALGVVFSTYLNAPVSLMLVWLFMILGTAPLRSFMETLIKPSDPVENPGGNIAESMWRMANRQALTTPLEDSQRTTSVIRGIDAVFQNFFKAVYNIIPDLGQYQRTMFVAEGFNIPGEELLASFLLMLLYLFPYLLLGYYLINVREIAA